MTDIMSGSSRYRHYAIDLKRYYRLPAVQASLSTVLSLFITAFFIIAAIRPTIITITKLNRTISDAEKTLGQLSAKEKAIVQAASVWEQLKDKVPYVDASIPIKGPEYQLFLKSIEYLAIQNQVSLSSESVGSALLFSDLIAPYKGKVRTVTEMPINLRVTGNYENVITFYQQLNQMDRLINVESVSINNDTSLRNKGGAVSLSVSGSVGYLADTNILKSIIQSKDK